MRITLTRPLGPHPKGAIRDVTPALAARLMKKGAAKVSKGESHADVNAADDATNAEPDAPAADDEPQPAAPGEPSTAPS